MELLHKTVEVVAGASLYVAVATVCWRILPSKPTKTLNR